MQMLFANANLNNFKSSLEMTISIKNFIKSLHNFPVPKKFYIFELHGRYQQKKNHNRLRLNYYLDNLAKTSGYT